jgi:methionyl-tRNA synthetase
MATPFYITTPIYYVNDVPHLGHFYTTLAADVLARFHRIDGRDVRFLTGVDEHGQKVAKSAEKAGVDPQAFVDKVSLSFREMVKLVGATNDNFIRTTEARHKAAVQALWQKMEASGNIYRAKYGGWYAVRDEAYYGEDELKDGPGGKKIAPSGAEVEWVEEESYYFKLSAWQDKLLEFYDKHPDFIAPAIRRNEVVSFVKGGLQDLSISRTTFNWGVPVPGAPGHVMYVWVDALTNYITELGYPSTTGDYAKYWPHSLHLVGKDILRFHAVYWPAFLMAAGLEPPHRVFAHGWWMSEGEKMSKSLGNVIVPSDIVATYGLDAVRYFLMREMNFGSDGNFTKANMIVRMNSDLANDYGNLCQRVLSQIAKNCEGKVPAHGVFTAADEALLSAARNLPSIIRAELEQQAISKALEAIWQVTGAANRYVDEQAPWALKKTDIARMNTVLYVLAEVIRHVATMTQPFVPSASEKILDQLAVAPDARTIAALAVPLAVGTALPPPQGVFPRYVEADQAANG